MVSYVKGIKKLDPEASIWAKRYENGDSTMSNFSLYDSSNIIRLIKSRTIRWTGHITTMEEGRSAFKILTGKPMGKIISDGLGVDSRLNYPNYIM